MLDIDLFEDSSTVICDYHITHAVYEHLVHALGTQGGAYRICDGFSCCNIPVLGVLPRLTCSSFSKDYYRLTA